MNKTAISKQPSPKALQKLQKYLIIRDKLINYFFKGYILSISNDQMMNAYQQIYDLLTNIQQRVVSFNRDKYQSYEQTFINQYKKDLTNFSQQTRQLIIQSTNLSQQDYVQYVIDWVYNYTRFMHSILRNFQMIQRNVLHSKGTSLYFEGLKILKNELFVPIIYDILFTKIIKCIQLQKTGQLKSGQPLRNIIRIIGVLGFKKFTNLYLQKQGQKFEIVSNNISSYRQAPKSQMKSQQKLLQYPYQTQFFRKYFVHRYINIMKQKYQKLVNDKINLSTSDFVNFALESLRKQEQIADKFYPHKDVKDIVIRAFDQILAHDKAEILIKKPQTGLFSMLQQQKLTDARRLLELIKRSSNFKLFTKQYQRFIQAKGCQILQKVTEQDQKVAKKQVVSEMIQNLYKLYELIQRITSQVSNNDTQIQTCQTYGFQQICNKGEKVCNFLVYYADNILKKQQDNMNQSSDLILKISKISKHLYSYDMFIKLYQRLLGLRMLYDCFKKKDQQIGIINLLKNQAGVSTLNKISCMVSDYMFSENFNVEKGHILSTKVGFKMQVMVLTSGSWQINDTKNKNSSVPKQLLHATDTFQKMYNDQLPDRTLTWVFNYGRAIVTAQFQSGRYILIINSNIFIYVEFIDYQLSILLYLQRNNFKNAKLLQLLQQLKVQQQACFNQALMNLLKSQVILKQGNPSKFQSKNEQIYYNMKLKSNKPKIKCFQLPRYIEKGNSGQSVELILERSHLVDAAIVKIMKSKRVVQYAELIAEVQKMCKTFKADTTMIKKRIQNCQERQYLERDPEDMNKLVYLP